MTVLLLAASAALEILAQVLKVLRVRSSAPLGLDLAAIILLQLALYRLAPAAAESVEAPPAPTKDRMTRGIASLLIVAGGFLSLSCSALLLFDWANQLLTVLVLGPLALLTLSLGLDTLTGFGPLCRREAQRARRLLGRREVQIFGLILLAGIFFRFVSLGFYPPVDGFSSIEESQRGTGGWQILDLGARPWEFPLAQYIAAAAFAVFGYSIHALRIPVMIMGCVTLGVFYLLAREIAAPPAALFATALLAVSRWHVQVSWYNEDVYVPLLPFTIIVYLLLRTRREHRPLLYVIIGACSGYALYDYAPYRVTIGVVLIFFACEALWRRGLRAEWRQVAVLAVVFAFFAAPLTEILRQTDASFYVEALRRSLAHTDYYTTDWQSFVAQRFQRLHDVADMFTVSDHHVFFPSLNSRGEALLDPFTSAVFVLGFGTTLLQPWRRHHAFVALAFLFLAAGTTVVVSNLDFRRLSILTPFVFAFIVLVTDQLDRLTGELGAQRAFRAGLVGIALLAAAYNYHFLFHVLARDHEARAYHRDHYTVPAFYLHDHYRGEYVVLLTAEVINFFTFNDYEWIKPRPLRGQVALGVEAVLPIDPAPPKGDDVLLLILTPFHINTVMAQVRDYYPDTACELRPDPDDHMWDLGVCHIPRRSLPTPIQK